MRTPLMIAKSGWIKYVWYPGNKFAPPCNIDNLSCFVWWPPQNVVNVQRLQVFENRCSSTNGMVLTPHTTNRIRCAWFDDARNPFQKKINLSQEDNESFKIAIPCSKLASGLFFPLGTGYFRKLINQWKYVFDCFKNLIATTVQPPARQHYMY